MIFNKIEHVSVYSVTHTIGVIRVLSYVFTIWFKVIQFETTSTGDGTVTIPITPQRFSEDHSYEIHITTADAIGVNEKQSITIGESIADCVQLRFVTIWENDNTIATFTNQQLSTVWC